MFLFFLQRRPVVMCFAEEEPSSLSQELSADSDDGSGLGILAEDSVDADDDDADQGAPGTMSEDFGDDELDSGPLDDDPEVSAHPWSSGRDRSCSP